MAHDKGIDNSGWVAGLWLAGWLFTMGYVHLGVQKSLLGLVLWPYYLGVKLGG